MMRFQLTRTHMLPKSSEYVSLLSLFYPYVWKCQRRHFYIAGQNRLTQLHNSPSLTELRGTGGGVKSLEPSTRRPSPKSHMIGREIRGGGISS